MPQLRRTAAAQRRRSAAAAATAVAAAGASVAAAGARACACARRMATGEAPMAPGDGLDMLRRCAAEAEADAAACARGAADAARAALATRAALGARPAASERGSAAIATAGAAGARAAALRRAYNEAAAAEATLRAARRAKAASAAVRELRTWNDEPLPPPVRLPGPAQCAAPSAPEPPSWLAALEADLKRMQDAVAADTAAVIDAGDDDNAAEYRADGAQAHFLAPECAALCVRRLACGGVRFATRCAGETFCVRVKAGVGTEAGDAAGGAAFKDAPEGADADTAGCTRAWSVACEPWLPLELSSGAAPPPSADELVRAVWRAARARRADADALCATMRTP